MSYAFPGSSSKGPLSASHRTTECLVVPDSADVILLKAMSAQRHAANACKTRALDEEAEEQCKAERLKVLREQIERRNALDELSSQAESAMSDMLDLLTNAVRERQTTLRTEGYQTFVFPNGDVYEGEWKNGRMHGRGVLKQSAIGGGGSASLIAAATHGAAAVGSPSSSMAASPTAAAPSLLSGSAAFNGSVGAVSATMGDSDLYEGEWFLGVKNGIGIKHYGTAKTMYSGKWVDGKRHGRGELMEPEGMYTGEFHSGRIHGLGEYVYADGHVYKGEWIEERYEGSGTYLFPSGAKYEGTWKRGRENGRGTKTFRNGDVYSGEWYHGQMHGVGQYTGISTTFEGEWHYGTMSGHGTCRYTDGSSYVGEWEKGKYHGAGVFQDPGNAITYDGQWHVGRRHGEGAYTSAFHTYHGEWRHDKKHGTGNLSYPGRGVLRGLWVNDLPQGEGIYVGGIEGSNIVRYEAGTGVCIAKDEKEVFKRVNVALDSADL